MTTKSISLDSLNIDTGKENRIRSAVFTINWDNICRYSKQIEKSLKLETNSWWENNYNKQTITAPKSSIK